MMLATAVVPVRVRKSPAIIRRVSARNGQAHVPVIIRVTMCPGRLGLRVRLVTTAPPTPVILPGNAFLRGQKLASRPLAQMQSDVILPQGVSMTIGAHGLEGAATALAVVTS